MSGDSENKYGVPGILRNSWVIEGLNMKRVRPGRVQLVCLPLKIAGGDGAPARALVRPMGRLGRR